MAHPHDGHPLRRRRAEHLRREIALLERMDSRLWRRALVYAAIGIVATTLLLMAVAAKLQFFGYHPVAITVASLALAALAWWIGRYSLWVPLLLIVLLLAILTEGHLDYPDFGDGKKGKAKPDRRAKLDIALAKRRAALAKLEERG